MKLAQTHKIALNRPGKLLRQLPTKLVPMNSAPFRRLAVSAAGIAALLCVSSIAMPAQTPPPSVNRSGSFAPGSCGPADSAYIRTANETGGIPMFLQRSEAMKAFHLVRESTKQNVSTVLWATGVLDGRSQNFDIPVDSVTQRITFTFSVNTKGAGLALRQPSGQLIPRLLRTLTIRNSTAAAL